MIVAVFRNSSGDNYDFVYLQDLYNGGFYQIFVECDSVGDPPFAAFSYYDPDHTRRSPSTFPPYTAAVGWDGDLNQWDFILASIPPVPANQQEPPRG
jgi:hypothetical protein